MTTAGYAVAEYTLYTRRSWTAVLGFAVANWEYEPPDGPSMVGRRSAASAVGGQPSAVYCTVEYDKGWWIRWIRGRWFCGRRVHVEQSAVDMMKYESYFRSYGPGGRRYGNTDWWHYRFWVDKSVIGMWLDCYVFLSVIRSEIRPCDLLICRQSRFRDFALVWPVLARCGSNFFDGHIRQGFVVSGHRSETDQRPIRDRSQRFVTWFVLGIPGHCH